MNVAGERTTLTSPGSYRVAVFSFVENNENIEIVQRGEGSPQGLVTWGMSGCHGVAVFGGQVDHDEVDWIAMYHVPGGLSTSRLEAFLRYLGETVPQPGGAFQWCLVMSQGNEIGGDPWASLKKQINGIALFERAPSAVYYLDGPAPGGSEDGFAIDFAGNWGSLGGTIIKPPLWAAAPRNKHAVQVGNGANGKGCCKCYITTACCEHLGLPDDCIVLTTLRRYRDEILASTPDGRKDIETYYRIAPEIVSRLDSLADAHRVYVSIYENYLIPAVESIQKTSFYEAYRIYNSLVTTLNERYR